MGVRVPENTIVRFLSPVGLYIMHKYYTAFILMVFVVQLALDFVVSNHSVLLLTKRLSDSPLLCRAVT